MLMKNIILELQLELFVEKINQNIYLKFIFFRRVARDEAEFKRKKS
jgi:hypothetical protein